MALSFLRKRLLLKRAKELGFPKDHKVIEAIEKGSEEAANKLLGWVKERDKNFDAPQSKSINKLTEQLNPEKDYFNNYRSQRGDVKNQDGYQFERFPYGKPEDDFLTGRPEYYENIPLVSRNQSNYMNSLLDFAADKMPQEYDKWSKMANRGALDEIFGNNASQGFEKLMGQLGEYAPSLLAAGAGSALTGGGIGDILQSLIGTAAGQYARDKYNPSGLINNISSGIGNYYNQGINALGDLWNNQGQFRR